MPDLAIFKERLVLLSII